AMNQALNRAKCGKAPRKRWPEPCTGPAAMKLLRIPSAILVALIATFCLALTSAWALDPGPDGYYHTGTGIRTKSIAFIDVKVYEISHFMKQLPERRSKQAVIDMDVDKKISWKMLRDVDAEKIQNALREAYRMNGYGDGGKIGKFTGVFTNELKEGS